jgi:hypothetical protein
VPEFSPELLSKELLVAREIHLAAKESPGEPVYFNKIVERLTGKGLAVRGTVSKALDILFDQGVVRAEWKQTKDHKHVRALYIAGEAKQFVDAIVKATASGAA